MSVNLTDFTLVNQIETEPENTVVIVGTALDGPSQVPFTLNIDADPYDVLGQSPLAHAYNAARRVGTENIVAYRLNGVHSTATLKDRNGKEVMAFQSVSAGDDYNNIQMIVYSDHLYVVGTNGAARSYFFDKYLTAVDLAYGINRDAYYGLIEINAVFLDEYYVLKGIVDDTVEVMFEGGLTEEHLITSRDPLSETTTDASAIIPLLQERLEYALFGYDIQDIADRHPNNNLGMLNCGVITICDMYHDDNSDLTEILGSFCKNKTDETGYGCIGVIGTRPIYPANPDEGEEIDYAHIVKTSVIELQALSDSLTDKEAYKYVQVVVGHTIYPESNGEHVSLAYAYAASQAQYPYYTMMSNKAISGFGKLNYDITKEDVALLTSNGYTCIIPSIRRGFVPYYATSFSKDKESIMAKPHHLRISQYVSRTLVEELDSLVGNTSVTLSIKDAIDRANEFLTSLVTSNIIRTYELTYELSSDSTQLDVNVSLTPYSEIKAINSIATISFPQGVIA